MTAEIAVANKWGVALAADSAVTTEQFHKNRIVEKVYNSANKLFTVSKFWPVGAMIYNGVSIGGTPWETIIKCARSHLGRKRFDTLPEYADYLFSFMITNAWLFPKESLEQQFRVAVYRIMYKLYKNKMAKKEFTAQLDKTIARLEKLKSIDLCDESFEKNVIADNRKQLDDAYNLILPTGHVSGNKRKLDRVVQLSFCKKERLSGYSGVVICGFGEKDIFPSLLEFYCDAIISGKLRYWLKAKREVSASSGAFVLPFADTEIVKTLTEGVNPRFQKKYHEEAIKVVMSLPGAIIERITQLTQAEKNQYKNAAIQPSIDMFMEFDKKMREYRKDEHVEPIEHTIESLPLSELAAVAETFLSTSQIYKRVNPETETVGGPVDLAVISKGDGFVWIKRKHYFSEDLNKAFGNKYLEV